MCIVLKTMFISIGFLTFCQFGQFLCKLNNFFLNVSMWFHIKNRIMRVVVLGFLFSLWIYDVSVTLDIE